MKISLNDRIHSCRDMDEGAVQKQPAEAPKFEEFLAASTTAEQTPKKTEPSARVATGPGFAGNVGTHGHANDKTPAEPAGVLSATETTTKWAFAQGPGFAGDFGTSGHGNDK